jgi:ribosomal protein L7/L12
MPFTLAQAIEVAKLEILRRSSARLELKILFESTEEFDVGWVFYYQSARYVETGNLLDCLAGNAPLFVARSDGRSFTVRVGRPLAESLAAYRACGDPNAQEIPEVDFHGWRKGAQTVTAIKAIRQHTIMGLAQAKSVVDVCLANRSSTISVPTVVEARALVAALDSAGFEARVCYDR